MRYVPRLPRRWGALTLVGVVILAGATFASGGVAQASDDWTTGHSSFRYCSSNGRNAEATLEDMTPSGVKEAGYVQIGICYRASSTGHGYDVDVQGFAWDEYGDGECITARIRYKVYIGGAWSGWQYRNMATACPAGTTDTSTVWYSRYPTTSVQGAACFRDTATSTVSNSDCSYWT
jgi:hypothetical protein